METNGEIGVLKILSAFSPKCIFDVGANIGEWSRLVSTMNRGCKIHAFELVPQTYEILLKNAKDLNNVITNNFGLSNGAGTISVNLGPDSGMATAFKIEGMKFHDEYYKEKVTCYVRTAAEYIQEKKIDLIDFVKVDVEGMDLRVIKGFGNKLANVRAIQFEYGIFNISSHDLLSDFCIYLNSNGFIVGKIFPRCVQFFDYHFDMENFHGSNFIAIRKDEKEMIEKLSRYQG